MQNSKQFGWNHPADAQLRPPLVGHHQHPQQQQPQQPREGKGEQQLQQLGCAFANPYFTDAPERRQTGKAEQSAQQLYFIENHISKLHSRQVTSSVKELSIAGESKPEPELRRVGRLPAGCARVATPADRPAANPARPPLLTPNPTADFQHPTGANEHDDQQAAEQVVDLTSEEQRARIIACPREVSTPLASAR